MDAREAIEAGRQAAQAWLDGKQIVDLQRDVWLQVLVAHDSSAEVIPCTFRPEGEQVREDGPATGPDGEPGVALKLWRPLDCVTLVSGTRVAVFVEKEALDDQGNKRDLWMPI